MEVIQVESIKIELIKVNAVKLKADFKKPVDGNQTHDSTNPEKGQNKINITIQQKEEKQAIDFSVTYIIPLISGKNFSFDAELLGSIILKDSIDTDELFKDSNRKKFYNSAVPRILEAVDNKLMPVFNSMDLEYTKLANNEM